MTKVTHSSDFIYPQGRYYGSVQPEALVFNANLQEFSQRVSLICGLQTNGKLSPEEAYQEVHELWKRLKHSKKALKIGQNPFQAEE